VDKFSLEVEMIRPDQNSNRRVIRCQECRLPILSGKIHEYDDDYFIYCKGCGDQIFLKKKIKNNYNQCLTI